MEPVSRSIGQEGRDVEMREGRVHDDSPSAQPLRAPPHARPIMHPHSRAQFALVRTLLQLVADYVDSRCNMCSLYRSDGVTNS